MKALLIASMAMLVSYGAIALEDADGQADSSSLVVTESTTTTNSTVNSTNTNTNNTTIDSTSTSTNTNTNTNNNTNNNIISGGTNNTNTNTNTNINTNTNTSTSTSTIDQTVDQTVNSTNTNTNTNNNTSTSTNTNTNNNTNNNTNVNKNTTDSTQTIKAPPPSAIAPTVNAGGNDTCTVSYSAAVQSQVLGIAGGGHVRDLNCERLKNAKTLYNMGMKVASVALMCQDPRVFQAMKMAGTPCPFEGKIGEEASQLWSDNPDLMPTEQEQETRRNDTAKGFGLGILGAAALMYLTGGAAF